mgnify:CR=1 FL=1
MSQFIVQNALLIIIAVIAAVSLAMPLINTNHYLVPSTCFIRQPEEALYLLTSILAAGYGFSTHTFDQGLLSQWPKVAPL